MGRHSKDDVQRIGPRLWARYLKRHFKCSSLAPLNAQLLLPITPFEVFAFAENPPPLPLRLAPKILERAHDLGRSPDGAYTPEIHGSDAKSGEPARFNLYDRITQRVPDSKYWLLKEIEPFLYGGPPSIDMTVRLLHDLLADLDLVLVEDAAIASWECLDLEGVRAAEMDTVIALSDGELPEYVALVYALCHACVWQLPPRIEDRLSNSLLFLCPQVATNFVTFLQSENFDFGDDLASDLLVSLFEGAIAIGERGVRSVRHDQQLLLPDLTGRLVLAPNTEATRRSISCLTEQVDLRRSLRHSWPKYRASIAAGQEIHRASKAGPGPAEAAQQLANAVSSLPALLKARARRVLGEYRHRNHSGCTPSPAAFFSFGCTH
ncbi:hypothetical protein [Dyella jiangningensis]